MAENNTSIYFADYLDYSIEKRGSNIIHPLNQLKYDLLCFYPQTIALTLTSTLIDESTMHFVQLDEFWRNGALKIHFSQNDTADKYHTRKLSTMKSADENNYENKLYLSNGADDFIYKYLKKELLDQGVNYVLTRESDADKNNRETVVSNWQKYEREIIESLQAPNKMKKYDKITRLLDNLSNDKTFTFQRSHIMKELVGRKLIRNEFDFSPIILSTLDTSYSQAMAKSINATRISTMDTQLNGIGLRNFLKGFSNDVYQLINKMTPHQTFLLAQDRSWQIFRNFISYLYFSLASKHFIHQSSDFYKNPIKIQNRNEIINFCLEEMTSIVYDMIKQFQPNAFLYIESAKKYFETYYVDKIKNLWKYKRYTDEEIYYCEEIIKRRVVIRTICEDIINEKY